MYCPKCGEQIPEGSRFCMHCGADLSEYTVEVAPKIEVSPKISVSAKAESGMTLKWKQEPIKYAKIEGVGKLPVYEEDTLAKLEDKHFCPFCGNYASLKKLEEMEGVYEVIEKGEEKEVYAIYHLYRCLACDELLLGCIEEEIVLTEFERNFKVESEKIPAYKNAIFCEISKEDKVSLSSEASVITWEKKDGTMWYFLNKFGSYSLVAFCPICKRNRGYVTPVKAYSWGVDYDDGGIFYKTEIYYSNAVSGRWVEFPLYSLWECKFCGKFLVSHECTTEGKKTSFLDLASPMCEICDDTVGEYACSVCGKRICKDCSVKKIVKKRQFFFDKTTILCPNCAKEV